MTFDEYREKYRTNSRGTGGYCFCEVCGQCTYYALSYCISAVESGTALQCPNCQSYEVMPMRREQK